MLISQLELAHYPPLHLTDSVGVALQLMEDYEVQHLPVIDADNYVGLIARDDIEEMPPQVILQTISFQIFKIAINSSEHFLTAIPLLTNMGVSFLPVLNEGHQLLGELTKDELLKAISILINANQQTGIIEAEIERLHFSMSELIRIVESNDASITSLYIQEGNYEKNILITMKLNRLNIADVIASLQQYNYQINYFFGEDDYQQELKENYDLLMTYLNM